MASHAERVLSAILNKENPRRDLLSTAILRLEQEHFVDDRQRNIFRLLTKYYDRTGAVMPQDVFTTALEDAEIEPSKVLAYTKVYDQLAATAVGEADFKWSLDELRGEQAKRLTGIALTEAMEILERGYEPKPGVYYKGHEEARSYLSGRLSVIDRIGTEELTPEGNIFLDYEDVLKDYEQRKANTGSRGVLTGIRAIDDRVDGWQPGELIMVCAYAGLGKSQIVTQAAWDCAVMQKKHVFFATSETLRDQVMRRILARHSRLPIFDHPINSADIKKGTLSPADEKVFRDVLEDWHYNSDYAKLNVVQIPAHSKVTYVENRLKDYMKEVEVALAIDDYLPLHAPLTPRGNEREEYNETLRYSKGIATDTEIPFVSPWQMTREAYERSLNVGYYTKASLADTSEAEKSADQILAILREEENNTDMRLQFLKMRDDEIPPITQVSIDFKNTYIGANIGPATISAGITNADTDEMLSQVLEGL